MLMRSHTQVSRDGGQKIIHLMVGLPARGKSTISVGLREVFKKYSIRTQIYNNGELRRKYLPVKDTSNHTFYNPENSSAMELRKQIALINMQRAKNFLGSQGEVAIIDATNASQERRTLIEETLNDHPILYIECINNDKEILELSIVQKTKLPEFYHLDTDTAVENFKQRIKYYEMIYHPIQEEKNFIKVDSLNNKILGENLSRPIEHYSLIRDFLVSDIVKNLYLIRHTETYFNLEDRIGGDPELTETGKLQAEALGRFFKKKKIALIFTCEMKRTIQTAQHICEDLNDCMIVPLKEFNEINAGICECMTYEEIREKMPQVYFARKEDKYNYVYPKGESYATMKERIERGIKKAFYLNRDSANIMIIGHRAANRLILAHFLYRRDEDVPYIHIPQDKFYHITAMHDKKMFHLKKYQ